MNRNIVAFSLYAFSLSFFSALQAREPYSPALSLAIQWVLASGAGAISSWLMEFVQDFYPALKNLRPDYKTYLAIVTSGALGMAAFGLQVLFGYAITPVGTLGWIEGLFASFALAAGWNKIAHTATVVRRKYKSKAL